MEKRKLIHDKYYVIPAYQILSKKSDFDVANVLGITVRTYKDKINGYSDFSISEGRILAGLFERSQADLFLT
ncbi:MAG: hypothetical protein H6Q60_1174 [Oscillospiraceae bacterium]|nr:hypothetical protein [Oscillospiraceae bacterium]